MENIPIPSSTIMKLRMQENDTYEHGSEILLSLDILLKACIISTSWMGTQLEGNS